MLAPLLLVRPQHVPQPASRSEWRQWSAEHKQVCEVTGKKGLKFCAPPTHHKLLQQANVFSVDACLLVLLHLPPLEPTPEVIEPPRRSVVNRFPPWMVDCLGVELGTQALLKVFGTGVHEHSARSGLALLDARKRPGGTLQSTPTIPAWQLLRLAATHHTLRCTECAPAQLQCMHSCAVRRVDWTALQS